MLLQVVMPIDTEVPDSTVGPGTRLGDDEPGVAPVVPVNTIDVVADDLQVSYVYDVVEAAVDDDVDNVNFVEWFGMSLLSSDRPPASVLVPTNDSLHGNSDSLCAYLMASLPMAPSAVPPLAMVMKHELQHRVVLFSLI